MDNIVMFFDRKGEGHYGLMIREYPAFEGGMRYIIEDETSGYEYRCVKENGKYVELVV